MGESQGEGVAPQGGPLPLAPSPCGREEKHDQKRRRLACCSPPQDRQAPIAEVTPPGNKPELSVPHLPRAAVVP